MPEEQDDSLRQREPDARPLGFIAVGLAALSALLALSVVLSPLAYLPAVVAISLGFITRRDELTRAMGNTSLWVAFGAVFCATSVLLWVLFDDSFGY